MALSLGSGDFRGGNVFKLGDTLLEVFPFQREDGRTAKLPSIMFSPRSERASDLIVTSPALSASLPPLYAGKMENMRRPLDHYLKNLLCCLCCFWLGTF